MITFDEMVAHFSKIAKAENEKMDIPHVGPSAFFATILFTFFGLFIWVQVWVKWSPPLGGGVISGSTILSVSGFLAILLLFVGIAGFFFKETWIYPKAFWFWLKGEDPKTM